jgi:uncharacterized membrane protein
MHLVVISYLIYLVCKLGYTLLLADIIMRKIKLNLSWYFNDIVRHNRLNSNVVASVLVLVYFDPKSCIGNT